MRLLIDGYNLARSGSLALAHDPLSPEGRRELCELLASYAMAKGFLLTVVFDAPGAGRPARTSAPFKGGTALYTSAAETADDAIRHLARGAPGRTIVVTSDRGLAGTLPSKTVTVVSCTEFADRLFRHQLESVKGAADEDIRRAGHGSGKKGEGKRQKKNARRRAAALRKL